MSLLLCLSVSFLLHLSSSLVHENLQLDVAQHVQPLFTPHNDRGDVPERDPALFSDSSLEDRLLLVEAGYDEDSSAVLQLQGRAMRSPRRCISHQQSCLGSTLPCCDLCDTCYCRFFNAICYCRRVGHSCPPRHT